MASNGAASSITLGSLLLLIVVTCAPVPVHPRSLRGVVLEDGYAGWDTTDAACPCDDASLCEPIKTSKGEDVYAFHTGGDKYWQQYDWSQISTVCVFGALDPKMLCHAHKHGARVTFGSGGLTQTSQWHNETLVDEYVNSSVTKVTQAFADGCASSHLCSPIDRSQLQD